MLISEIQPFNYSSSSYIASEAPASPCSITRYCRMFYLSLKPLNAARISSLATCKPKLLLLLMVSLVSPLLLRSNRNHLFVAIPGSTSLSRLLSSRGVPEPLLADDSNNLPTIVILLYHLVGRSGDHHNYYHRNSSSRSRCLREKRGRERTTVTRYRVPCCMASI